MFFIQHVHRYNFHCSPILSYLKKQDSEDRDTGIVKAVRHVLPHRVTRCTVGTTMGVPGIIHRLRYIMYDVAGCGVRWQRWVISTSMLLKLLLNTLLLYPYPLEKHDCDVHAETGIFRRCIPLISCINCLNGANFPAVTERKRLFRINIRSYLDFTRSEFS